MLDKDTGWSGQSMALPLQQLHYPYKVLGVAMKVYCCVVVVIVAVVAVAGG